MPLLCSTRSTASGATAVDDNIPTSEITSTNTTSTSCKLLNSSGTGPHMRSTTKDTHSSPQPDGKSNLNARFKSVVPRFISVYILFHMLCFSVIKRWVIFSCYYFVQNMSQLTTITTFKLFLILIFYWNVKLEQLSNIICQKCHYQRN